MRRLIICRRAQKVLLGDLLPGSIKPLLGKREIWMKEAKGMSFPWLSGVRKEIEHSSKRPCKETRGMRHGNDEESR